MIKTVTKIGNSQGVIFDAALMDLAHLKVGDQLVVSVHEGGTILLTPTAPVIDAEKASTAAKRLIEKNSELFRRLS
jgi:antitoxin component of MazEF toxin-antitoxin module